jgi:hypothetical protein
MSDRTSCQVCVKSGARTVLLRMLLVVACVLAFSPITAARADTSVCGPISVDTTWTAAGNAYVVTCLVHVLSGVTLTIEPGVRIYFDPGMSIRVDGGLVARGVTFSSNKATPAKGDWGRIYFTATSVDAVLDANGEYVSGSTIQESVLV